MKPNKFNSRNKLFLQPRKKPNGFTLFESMLSLTIFSLFLLITWEAEQHIFKQLSDVFKDSDIQMKHVKKKKKRLAYPGEGNQ